MTPSGAASPRESPAAHPPPVNRQEKGPLLLLYEQFYVLILVTLGAVVVAFLLSKAATPMFRGQARGFLPTTQDMLNVTTEEGNLPTGPKLPVASSEMQDSLVGMAKAATLRERVANAVPEVNYEYLEKHVEIEIDKYNMLCITAWHADAQVAARIADAYMSSLEDMLRDVNQTGVRESLAVLQGQIDGTQQALDALEQQRLAYLNSENTVDYGTEFQALAARIDRLRTAQSDLDVQIGSLDDQVAATQGQLAERKKLLQDGAFILSSQAQVQNSLINDLRKEIADSEVKLIELRSKYTDQHPLVQAELERKSQLERELAQESAPEHYYQSGSRSYTLDTIAQGFETQLYQFEVTRASLQAEREERQKELDQALKDWQAMPSMKAQLDLLDQKVAQVRTTLTNELARADEFHVFQARRPDYVQVTERPVPDAEPKYPNVPLNVGVAGMLGIITSIVLIVIMDRISYHRERAPW